MIEVRTECVPHLFYGQSPVGMHQRRGVKPQERGAGGTMRKRAGNFFASFLCGFKDYNYLCIR